MASEPDSIAVVVPTYNEAENIEALATQLLALPLPLRVIIVDDNSPDGTGDIVDRLAAADGRVIPIHRPAKLGLGTAHIAGFRRALADGAKFILSMDADFSHNPRYIPAMVAKIASATWLSVRAMCGAAGRAFVPCRASC